MSNLKINPFGFREYDARWLYEKDINPQGITNLGKGLGTQIINQTKKKNPRGRYIILIWGRTQAILQWSRLLQGSSNAPEILLQSSSNPPPILQPSKPPQKRLQ